MMNLNRFESSVPVRKRVKGISQLNSQISLPTKGHKFEPTAYIRLASTEDGRFSDFS